MTDLQEYNKRLLEQTRIYFYPKISSGPIKVYTDIGISETVQSEQSFVVHLSVYEHTYKNTALISEIERTTIKAIDNYLYDNTTLSVSQLQSNLRGIYGSNVIDVVIEANMFDGHGAITMVDESNRFSILKKLYADAVNNIFLAEDVSFKYKRL